MDRSLTDLGVCMVSESYYPNVDGGAIHSRLINERISDLGVNVLVVSLRNDSSYRRSEIIAGIPVTRVGWDSRLGRFFRYLAMLNVCIPLIRDRNKYDVIVVPMPRILALPAVIVARLLRKKCVIKPDTCGEMDGTYVLMDVSSRSSIYWLARQYFRLRNRIVTKADAFIAISEPIVQELLAIGIPGERIVKIPNGVDVERFSPVSTEKKRRLRESFGLSETQVVFMFCGRLSREKGLVLLLDVWKELAARFETAHLFLVGSGEGMTLGCEGQLRQMVAEYGLENSVTFTGEVDDVIPYLRCADIFVMPSWTESQCLALVEAQACGLPAIATRVGGLPEVVEHGVNGILVTLNDEMEMYEAAAELIKNGDTRVQLGSMARTTAVERFSIMQVANRYVSSLRSLVFEGPDL